ncbi:11602_t:CDS:2, partial [Acaulospora colombiana]
SRVETQVKLRVELVEVSGAANSEAAASTSNGGADLGLSYGKPATHWKYVKVPKTASVKVKSKGVCGGPGGSMLSSMTITGWLISSDHQMIGFALISLAGVAPPMPLSMPFSPSSCLHID